MLFVPVSISVMYTHSLSHWLIHKYIRIHTFANYRTIVQQHTCVLLCSCIILYSSWLNGATGNWMDPLIWKCAAYLFLIFIYIYLSQSNLAIIWPESVQRCSFKLSLLSWGRYSVGIITWKALFISQMSPNASRHQKHFPPMIIIINASFCSYLCFIIPDLFSVFTVTIVSVLTVLDLLPTWMYKHFLLSWSLGHGADVKCVDWHPTKGLVVSGSKDSQQPIKFWDPKTGQSLATL